MQMGHVEDPFGSELLAQVCMDERRQKDGGQAKIVQTHPPDLVRAVLSMSQRPIWVRYRVPAAELHSDGTAARSQEVQDRHAVDASLLSAVSKLAEERRQEPRRKPQQRNTEGREVPAWFAP